MQSRSIDQCRNLGGREGIRVAVGFEPNPDPTQKGRKREYDQHNCCYRVALATKWERDPFLKDRCIVLPLQNDRFKRNYLVRVRLPKMITIAQVRSLSDRERRRVRLQIQKLQKRQRIPAGENRNLLLPSRLPASTADYHELFHRRSPEYPGFNSCNRTQAFYLCWREHSRLSIAVLFWSDVIRFPKKFDAYGFWCGLLGRGKRREECHECSDGLRFFEGCHPP